MENMDNVFIDGLEEACKIGTTPEERAFPQPIVVSTRLFFPLSAAGKADDLTHSVDYASVAGDIRSFLSYRDFNLVEAVAESIADLALKYVRVCRVWVRVEKRVLPAVRSVGVEIWRERSKE